MDAFKAGTIFDGHYEILNVVGAGGMGTVYRARDVHDDAVVALKILNIEENEAQRRFLREFNILSRIQHPRIVCSRRWGVFKRMPYFAMDYISGRTLRDLINDSQCQEVLGTTRFLQIVWQIGDALDYIHKLGFVHQDLKPSNIMISEENGNLDVVILDLGLARLQASRDNHHIQLGTTSGTLEYMSPEQIRGRSLDQRSDLYSLGIIMYEVLTGKPPFTGGSPSSVMSRHLKELPKPPKEPESSIYSSIGRVVMKLLEKQPTDRYNTVGDFMQDIPNVDVGSSESVNGCVPISEVPAAFFEPQFQGREQELISLQELLRDADEGIGRIVLVSGEAGIGKSQILEEFQADARIHGMRVLTGRCIESGVMALAPFLQTLQGIPETLGESDSDIRDSIKVVHAHFERPASDHRTDPYPAMHVLSEFLTKLSRQTPTLVCIEDIQWADDLSLRFLEFMRRNPNPTPLVFALTCRNEGENQLPSRIKALFDDDDFTGVTHFRLKALSFEETANLAASLLGERTVPTAEARRIHEETGGNPLFVVELIRGSILNGLVRQDLEGQWQWPQAAEWPIPTGINNAIERRIKCLSPHQRMILECASSFRWGFSFDLIAEVCRGDELQLFNTIQGLVRQGLLKVLKGSDGSYRFSHGLIQRAVYLGISEDKRVHLHLEVGKALERSVVADEVEVLHDLAFHFSRSNDLKKMVQYVTVAGRRALRMQDFSAALRQFEAVIDKGAFTRAGPAGISKGSVAHLDFLCAYAEALLGCDRYEDVARELDEVMDHVSSDTPAQKAHALRMLGIIQTHSGNFKEAKTMWINALNLFRTMGDDENELLIIGLLSNAFVALNNHDKAIEYCNSASEKCREFGGAVYEARALIYLAFAADIDRRIERAKALLDSSLDLLDREGDHVYRQTCLFLLGRINFRLGNLDVAEAIFHELQAFRWRCGAKGWEAEAHLYLGRIALEQEEVGKAEAHARLAEGLLSDGWREEEMYTTCALLAQALAETGRVDEAHSWAERAWPGVEYGGNVRAMAWIAKAKSLAASGRHGEVDSLFNDVSENQGTPQGAEQVNLLIIAGAYYLARGRLANALRYLEDAKSAADRLVLPYYASKAAKILERMPLEGETTMSTREMVPALTEEHLLTLYQVSEDLTSVLDLNTLLDRILERLLNVSRAERALVALKDETGLHIQVARSHNLDNESTQEISRGIIRLTMDRNEAIVSLDAQVDERFKKQNSVIDYGIRSVMCLPLHHAESGVIGALYMDHRKLEDRFNENNRVLLSAFGNMVSIAVINARMYSKISERALFYQRHYEGRNRVEELVGQSQAMQEVFKLLDVAARSDVNVLIEGETGTGKELAARAIHARSNRKSQAFLSANCAAMTQELLQSELFGHKKGAFTGALSDRKGLFASADGGTVFLDEIGNASPQLQSSLLRVLQDGEIQPVGETEVRNANVRVIAATNRDLEADVQRGLFREDLYYRLRVLQVDMPPLRDRIEDIPLLSGHILTRVCSDQNKVVTGFSVGAMRALMDHDWPGNVRELENEIRRSVAMVEAGCEVSAELLSETIYIPEQSQTDQRAYFKNRMALLARRMIIEALEQFGGNITKAADRLGLSRNGLQKMMTRYGLR